MYVGARFMYIRDRYLRSFLRLADASGVMAENMMYAVISCCSLGFGLLFPAYGSFMAIESSGTEDDTQVRTVTDDRGFPHIYCLKNATHCCPACCSGWYIGCCTPCCKALRNLHGPSCNGKLDAQCAAQNFLHHMLTVTIVLQDSSLW